jgi:hypothetical protein
VVIDPLLAQLLVLGIAAAVVGGLVWRFQRWPPARRSFVQDRAPEPGRWEDVLGAERLPFARSVLETCCEAFLFDRTDAWRLWPEDTLRAIYKHSYPPQSGLADALEYESLVEQLETRFGIPEETTAALLASDPTLLAVVSYCHEHAR